jgi:hypothetical protein
MEANAMRDLLLQGAGTVAVIAAIGHGVIGEMRVFAANPKITIEPARVRRLLRVVWQAGTIAWICCGVLLLAAPMLASEAARHWIVATMIVVFAAAALGNALAVRGPHIGGVLMGAAVVLAVAGY